MAFTRQLNDSCETKKRIEESTSVLSYLMDPNKHYNCNPCYIDRIPAGNTVSLYGGNLVDLESDLSGRTRAATKCPSGKYLPGTIIQGSDVKQCGPECGADGLPCGRAGCNKVNLVHLPECTMVQYKPRPNDVGYRLNYPSCPPANAIKHRAKKSKTRKNLYSPIEYQGQQGIEEWPRY